MGTSGSSSGPKGGQPYDPPWIDDILTPKNDKNIPSDANGINGDPDNIKPSQSSSIPPLIAPQGRFRSARLNLGNFARTGDKKSFQKAVGHYSRTGMGGARNAAQRMRASTRSAANLFGVLQLVRNGSDPGLNEWVASLASRNASTQDIVNEIIRKVAPSGGSQDETSCRESMAQALEDLLDEYPEVNLLQLGDREIWALIEYFLGYEAFGRLCLDIGQVFENSSLSPRDRVTRMNEMQDYLQAELCAQVEKLRQTTPNPASQQLHVLLQSALENTFLVYEGAL